MRTREQVVEAYETITSRYPDFEEYRQGIVQAVAHLARGGNPGIARALEYGPIEQKVEILDQLYHAARSRQLGDIQQVAKAAAQTHVAETQRAKQEAMLASTSSTGQAKPSPADAVAQQWAEIKAPLRDGWLEIPE
jgi:hypothetical protein